MAILELVHHSDKILRAGTSAFDFSEPPIDPIQLAIDLTETMISNKGLGIAAPQVGMSYRVLAITGTPVYVMFNPKIVDYSTDESYLLEYTLSRPGLAIKIKRPSSIKVRFTQPNGETNTMKFSGLTARTVQHELDYLDGVSYVERSTFYHKQKGLKDQKAFFEIMKRSSK